MGQLATFFQSQAMEAVIQIEMRRRRCAKAAAQGFVIHASVLLSVPSVSACRRGRGGVFVTSLLDRGAFSRSLSLPIFTTAVGVSRRFQGAHAAWLLSISPASCRCRSARISWQGVAGAIWWQPLRIWPTKVSSREKQGRFLPNLTYAITAVRAVLPEPRIGGDRAMASQGQQPVGTAGHRKH